MGLDIYPEAEPAELGSFAGRRTIPTIGSGLEGIENGVTQLLDKVNDLRLEALVDNADTTLKELGATIAELRTLLASPGIQSLPHSIETSLDELDRTLMSVRALATSLEDRPNALLFSSEPVPDPEPRAVRP